jgi:hypothetical protein
MLMADSWRLCKQQFNAELKPARQQPDKLSFQTEDFDTLSSAVPVRAGEIFHLLNGPALLKNRYGLSPNSCCELDMRVTASEARCSTTPPWHLHTLPSRLTCRQSVKRRPAWDNSPAAWKITNCGICWTSGTAAANTRP